MFLKAGNTFVKIKGQVEQKIILNITLNRIKNGKTDTSLVYKTNK